MLAWGFRTDEKKIRIERLLLSRHGLYVTDFSFSKPMKTGVASLKKMHLVHVSYVRLRPFNFSGTFSNYNDALDEIDETMT